MAPVAQIIVTTIHGIDNIQEGAKALNALCESGAVIRDEKIKGLPVFKLRLRANWMEYTIKAG